MRRIGVSVLLSLCIASLGYADSQTHRQAAEEVLRLTKVDKMLGPLIDQIQQVQIQQLQQMNLSREAYSAAQRYLQRINDLVAREMQWQEIKNDYIGLYTDAFTEQELHQLIQFYSTPLGHKVIEKMPVLMEQSMQLGQKKMMKIMPEIQALSEEMLKEIQKQNQAHQ
ncbi:MAG: DUF2059 domain-containing protein [Desulfobacterales bacterium]|nr:DUF2059 domain-containing protein [Desulfobacterales bacterium]